MWIPGRPNRNIDAGDLLELFFVSAVACFLAIRAFLRLTGYPQLGGEGLHIAHMLWGGLLMLAALLLYFSYLDRRVHRVAALLGGIGFGTFIDELGKFITDDNNYFYKPTVPILYILFALIFLLLRSIRKGWRLRPPEALANALELLQASNGRAIDPGEKGRTLALLERADPAHPLVPPLRSAVRAIPAAPPAEKSIYLRWRQTILGAYEGLIRWPWFTRTLTAFFVVTALAKAIAILAVVWSPRAGGLTKAVFQQEEITVQGIASSLEALFVILGAWKLGGDRLSAYRWFLRSVLVSLVITQVFLFYEAQLAAITALALNILIYSGLRFLINREESARSAPQGGSSRTRCTVSGNAAEGTV